LTHSGRLTHEVVTRQPWIRRRSGKVRQLQTDVLTTEPRRQQKGEGRSLSRWLLWVELALWTCRRADNRRQWVVVAIDKECSDSKVNCGSLACELTASCCQPAFIQVTRVNSCSSFDSTYKLCHAITIITIIMIVNKLTINCSKIIIISACVTYSVASGVPFTGEILGAGKGLRIVGGWDQISG